MSNRFIKTLLFLISTFNIANAQSQDAILKKLIDNKLINKKEVTDFKKIQERTEIKNNTSYLFGLFQCEYKKTTGHFYSTFSADMISIEDPKLSIEEQKKENENLTDYLSKLKNCELLNEKQSQYYQQEIDKNSYRYTLQLIQDISFRAFKADYMSPEKLKKFADYLKDSKIVDTKYQSLLSAIDNEKIKEPIDFLLYCEKSIIIDTKNYSNKPEEYLEAIHRQTASLFLPELNFTDFKFKIVLDSIISDDDGKFYDFLVSFISNGESYKQRSFYNLYTPSKNKYSTGKIDSQNYYQIFNKILIDLKSPYRVHLVQASNGNIPNDEVFAIILLTKGQEKALNERVNYVMSSSEDFKNNLTSEQIKKGIEEFTKIGLFSNLTVEQIDEAKEKTAEHKNFNYNEILSAFPNIIYWYDTELGNLEEPYAELIKEFSKISHNEFNPTDISNKFDIEKSKKTTLKFKIGNKSYSKTFKIDNDWIDYNFFDFVKSVAIENKLKGQFYELYTGGQDAQVIYLTQQQYEYLRSNKLLTFSDEEPENDE